MKANENNPCAACGTRIGSHLLSQWVTCRAKLGLMPSLLELFPPRKKNEAGQWTPQGLLVFAVVAIVVVVVLLIAINALGDNGAFN